MKLKGLLIGLIVFIVAIGVGHICNVAQGQVTIHQSPIPRNYLNSTDTTLSGGAGGAPGGGGGGGGAGTTGGAGGNGAAGMVILYVW